MKWDNAADRRLLLTILDLYKVNIDWKQLAAKFGNDCGPRSVYIRMQKLRKEYEAENERFPGERFSGRSTMSSKSQKKKGIQGSSFDDDDHDGGNIKRERGTRDQSVVPKREPGVHIKEEGDWEDSMEREPGLRRRPNYAVQPARKEWRGQVIVIDD